MISVLIPSRTQPEQAALLARALASVRAQTVAASIEVRIGLDKGAPEPMLGDRDVIFVHASAASQAGALNAAAAEMEGDIVAILEDDDVWHPNYLELMCEIAMHAPFVTTNQIEAGEDSRLNDYATPSGWVMRRDTWARVGPFDESYRFHLDSDWLGRARELGVSRVHVVEDSAPRDRAVLQRDRPVIELLIEQGARLAYHSLPAPLVRRFRHAGAGMLRIAANPALGAQSRAEYQRLSQRYGRLPL